MPVLVGVWQKQAGLQVDQAGFVAAMELFAQVAGTAVFLASMRRGTPPSPALMNVVLPGIGSVIETPVAAPLPTFLRVMV